jgi:hypothetical protein
MALNPPRDLTPACDVKGGSPRTPTGGIPLRQYTESTSEPQVFYPESDGLWKAIATGFGGLVVGLLIAWFTAFQSKGVTRSEMNEYIEKYSPYAHDKELIALQQSAQDQKLGILDGFKDRILDRINKIEERHFGYDRDIADHDKKIKIIADYIEAEKTPQR